MYMVGAIPESLIYRRVLHNVKTKMQESVINGATQREALGTSSVCLNVYLLRIDTHETLGYRPSICSLGQVSREVGPSKG